MTSHGSLLACGGGGELAGVTHRLVPAAVTTLELTGGEREDVLAALDEAEAGRVSVVVRARCAAAIRAGVERGGFEHLGDVRGGDAA